MHEITPSTRLRGIDLARGLAIIGMVFVNFDVVMSYDFKEPALLRTLVNACTGRASATFVTLAGVGIVLLGNKEILLKRALFLLFVGYAWQVVWPGDILHYYAFYVAIGALCLGLGPVALGLLALACIGGFLLLMQEFTYGSGWNWLLLEYPDFWTGEGLLRNLIFNGYHPLIPWMAFLFTGMALAKCQINLASTRRFALIASVLIFVLASVLSQHFSSQPDTRSITLKLMEWYMAPESLYGLSSIPPGPFYMLSAGASAVFVICACLELGTHPACDRIVAPLIATGKLAFSLYLAHVLVMYFTLMPLVEYLQANLDYKKPQIMQVVFTGSCVFCSAAVWGSWAWNKRFGHGPMERLMRRLSRPSTPTSI